MVVARSGQRRQLGHRTTRGGCAGGEYAGRSTRCPPGACANARGSGRTRTRGSAGPGPSSNANDYANASYCPGASGSRASADCRCTNPCRNPCQQCRIQDNVNPGSDRPGRSAACATAE